MKMTISNLLNGCDKKGFESVALPAISTGIFCFPKDLAARCIYESAKEFFELRRNSNLKVVKVVMWEDGTKTYERFYEEMQKFKI